MYHNNYDYIQNINILVCDSHENICSKWQPIKLNQILTILAFILWFNVEMKICYGTINIYF